MDKWISDIVQRKIEILNEISQNGYMNELSNAGNIMTEALKSGNKIILAGNGGSAADAQHFAAELVCRFQMERRSLPAISLCVDPSAMTAIGNDYGFDEVYRKQIEGLGNNGDVFVAISTSGNSKNIINAIKTAKEKGITVVGLLGKGGGVIKDMCDISLIVPDEITARIQEIHTFSIHILCEMIEKELFS